MSWAAVMRRMLSGNIARSGSVPLPKRSGASTFAHLARSAARSDTGGAGARVSSMATSSGTVASTHVWQFARRAPASRYARRKRPIRQAPSTTPLSSRTGNTARASPSRMSNCSRWRIGTILVDAVEAPPRASGPTPRHRCARRHRRAARTAAADRCRNRRRCIARGRRGRGARGGRPPRLRRRGRARSSSRCPILDMLRATTRAATGRCRGTRSASRSPHA